MEFDKSDKSRAEAKLAAGHKEKAGKRSKRKASKEPARLKAAEKSPAEPKSLRAAWESLITTKPDKKESAKPHKSPEAEPKKPKNPEQSKPKAPEETKEAEPEAVVYYEEVEISLAETSEAEILLYPEAKAQIDSLEPEEPDNLKPAIEPWTAVASKAETSAAEPEIARPEPPVTELSKASEPTRSEIPASQSVDDIINQIHEAYGDTDPINKDLFNETSMNQAAATSSPEAGRPSATSSAGILESLGSQPLDRRQRNKVKKIVQNETAKQNHQIQNLEKTQKETVAELAAARTGNTTQAEYWRRRLSAQPANIETPGQPAAAAHPQAETVPKQTPEFTEHIELPPDHHLERSAWHAIEVDNKTGRAVEQPQAINYGEAFKQEQRQEALGQEEPDDVSVASGQLAVGTVANVGLQTSPLQPSPSKTTNLFNTASGTIRLGRGMSSSNNGDLWLWLVLGLVIISIIASLKF